MLEVTCGLAIMEETLIREYTVNLPTPMLFHDYYQRTRAPRVGSLVSRWLSGWQGKGRGIEEVVYESLPQTFSFPGHLSKSLSKVWA